MAIAELSERDWGVRTAVYRHFVDTGRAPAPRDLVTAAGGSVAQAESSLRRLADHHQLVLAPTTTNIWMAHPFSAIPTGFPVEARGHRYWANCAWDALGIPALLESDARVSARCAETGEPMEFSVVAGRLEACEGLIHMLVPPRSFYDNIGFT